MPGTGNKQKETKKILSIRLSADGLSFWTSVLEYGTASEMADTAGTIVSETGPRDVRFDQAKQVGRNVEALTFLGSEKGTGTSRVHLYVDTPRSILVPHGVSESESPEELFSAYGIAAVGDEVLLKTQSVGGTVALVAFPETILDELGETIKDYSLFSPLQYGLQRKFPGLTKGKKPMYFSMFLCPGRIYISAFGSGNGGNSTMVFCDHFPFATEADAVYYLGKVISLISARNDAPVFVSGFRAKETQKFLRKYYRKTRCE